MIKTNRLQSIQKLPIIFHYYADLNQDDLIQFTHDQLISLSKILNCMNPTLIQGINKQIHQKLLQKSRNNLKMFIKQFPNFGIDVYKYESAYHKTQWQKQFKIPSRQINDPLQSGNSISMIKNQQNNDEQSRNKQLNDYNKKQQKDIFQKHKKDDIRTQNTQNNVYTNNQQKLNKKQSRQFNSQAKAQKNNLNQSIVSFQNDKLSQIQDCLQQEGLGIGILKQIDSSMNDGIQSVDNEIRSVDEAENLINNCIKQVEANDEDGQVKSLISIMDNDSKTQVSDLIKNNKQAEGSQILKDQRQSHNNQTKHNQGQDAGKGKIKNEQSQNEDEASFQFNAPQQNQDAQQYKIYESKLKGDREYR